MRRYYKRIIALAAAVSAVVCVSADAAFEVTSGRIGDSMNRINQAYLGRDYNLVEQFVKIDESNIVDETIDAKLTVDEDTVINDEVSKRMLGFAFEASQENNETYLGINTLELSDEYKRMAKKLRTEVFKTPIVRYGGSSANTVSNILFHLGEMSERQNFKSIPTFYDEWPIAGGTMYTGKVSAVGPVEFVKAALELNPDTEFIICLPMESLTVDDLVSVVRFYMDPADKSEWGALRASCGLPDPVNVVFFEFGNENYVMEWDGQKFDDVPALQRVNNFADMFEEFYLKVHPLVPQAKFAVPIEKGAERRPEHWRDWNKVLAKRIGKYIDYAIPHWYYSGYEAHMWSWENDVMIQDFRDVLGEDTKVRLFATEHGAWYPQDDSWHFRNDSLYAVLSIAQYYNLAWTEFPYLEGSTLHSWSGYGFKFVRGKMLIEGMPHMMNVYLENLGNKAVKAELSSNTDYTEKGCGGRRFTQVTMTDDKTGDLIVFLTNRLPYTNFNIDFDFKNDYTLVEETVFTAPNIYSFVISEETEDLFTTTVTQKNIENFDNYVMPSKSLVVLRLKKK